MPTVDDSLNELQKELTEAMKAKDKVRVASLRHMRTALQKLVTSGSGDVTQDQVIASYRTLVKQRREAAEAYDKAGRPELAAQERAELEVIEQHLPKAPTQGQSRSVTADVIAQIRAEGNEPNMGAVMKAVMSTLGSAADGKAVSAVVRSELG